MSRICKKILDIPAVVTITVTEDNTVPVKSANGELTRTVNADIIIKIEDNKITGELPSEKMEHLALHGTT
ncbi:50S ribosomal protein L6, partial [Bacillus paranthracis]|uniref:50S ribosomal protein L6 n=1 Tax=Bacillus paranthracis TaxID=2026186 RepID=UPI002844D161